MPDITAAEAARRAGISHQAMAKAIRDGRVTRKSNGMVDSRTFQRELRDNTHPGRAKRVSGQRIEPRNGTPEQIDQQRTASSTYVTGRAAATAIKARMLELEYKRMAGEVVATEAVRKEAFEAHRRVRDLLLGMPARLAPVVAGLADAAECFREIEAEVKRICDELREWRPPA